MHYIIERRRRGERTLKTPVGNAVSLLVNMSSVHLSTAAAGEEKIRIAKCNVENNLHL